MYRSHPVRRVCEDPDPDATARLAVDAAAPDALADAVGSLDGRIVREGRFVTVVAVAATRVAALRAVDGLERVETADTLGLGLGLDPDVAGGRSASGSDAGD